MKNYIVSNTQLVTLQGLAFHVANLNKYKEKEGDNAPELIHLRENVSSLIDQCDRENIPFYAQNVVLVWAQNWRNTEKEYVSSALKRENVFIN